MVSSGSFKHDFSFEVDGVDIDSDDFFDEDIFELYRAFDFGLNFGIGYQLKSVLFNVGYSFGLSNLTPKYDEVSSLLFEGLT